MKDENKEIKGYKVYLLVLGIILIISFIMGYFYYTQLRGLKENLDETYNVLINGSDNEKQEVVDNFNQGIENPDEQFDSERAINLIKNYQKGDIYKMLDEGKDPEVISTLATQFLCVFHGFMIVIVLLNYLAKKYLKGLNLILRIILTVVVVIFLLPFTRYLMAIGSIGLPIAIVYCLYKMFTIKKTAKDKVPDEDVVEVEGKVDADEALEKKNTK